VLLVLPLAHAHHTTSLATICGNEGCDSVYDSVCDPLTAAGLGGDKGAAIGQAASAWSSHGGSRLHQNVTATLQEHGEKVHEHIQHVQHHLQKHASNVGDIIRRSISSLKENAARYEVRLFRPQSRF
jgi:hypothetical protein